MWKLHLLNKEHTQTWDIHSAAAHGYSRTTRVWNKRLLIQYRGRNQTRNQSDETKQAVYRTITACIRTLGLISRSSAEPSWVRCGLAADWGQRCSAGGRWADRQTTAGPSRGQWRRDVSQKPGFISPYHNWQLQNRNNRPYYTGKEHHDTINKYWYVYSLYILLLHKINFYITAAADFK